MSGPVPSPLPGPPARRREDLSWSQAKDGGNWRIGADAEVAWIANGTSVGLTITAAIPPVFEAYATVVLPERGEGQEEHDRAMLALLAEHGTGQPWWLGYLDTGVEDIVFPDAPMVTLYAGWHYVLAEAGPEQAATWRRRDDRSFWKSVLPNLMFPADHSWLISTLWDDDWTCIGGTAQLVDRFLRHPGLQARPVALGEDATPPGHQAR
jgi:hypothetical protein